ncbi:MAG TPA: ROK family protein [Terriglobales bacterium]|nr:ROK family protein [Terriglobales bacterium]
MSDSLLGVDIGGTKVAAGLVDLQGEILFKTRNPMNSRGSAEEGLSAVLMAINDALAFSPDANVVGIGLIAPGPLDPKRGLIINPPNNPCWRNYPLVQEVQKHYDSPVVLDNDANGAALAEAIWGAGRGYSNVFYATLGTGIGTGMVLDGKIFHGRTGAAAEGGHMTIDYRSRYVCGCGKPGCIEVLASGRAVARRAKEKAVTAPQAAALLLELADGKIDNITAELVGKAWKAGDPLATEILEETADMLAAWIGNIVDMIEPEVMVFGGGLTDLMKDWFAHIERAFPKWAINQRASEIPIVHAKYGHDAGVAGGAALCLSLPKAVSMSM